MSSTSIQNTNQSARTIAPSQFRAAQIALQPLVDRIKVIINKMDWKYQSADGKLLEFKGKEVSELIDAVRVIKSEASKLGVAISDLNTICLPIIISYEVVARKQGLEQFKAQLAYIQEQKVVDDLQLAIVKEKISIYEMEKNGEKYLIDHVKLKFKLRHGSTKAPNPGELETGMFLCDLFSHPRDILSLKRRRDERVAELLPHVKKLF